MSSAKGRLFSLGLNELKLNKYVVIAHIPQGYLTGTEAIIHLYTIPLHYNSIVSIKSIKQSCEYILMEHWIGSIGKWTF